MALLKALCWALIFIIRIRFPPGTSLATVLEVAQANCQATTIYKAGDNFCVDSSLLLSSLSTKLFH